VERSAGSPHHLSGLGDVKRKGRYSFASSGRGLFSAARKNAARARAIEPAEEDQGGAGIAEKWRESAEPRDSRRCDSDTDTHPVAACERASERASMTSAVIATVRRGAPDTWYCRRRENRKRNWRAKN